MKPPRYNNLIASPHPVWRGLDEVYLWRALCTVERNPVRAKMSGGVVGSPVEDGGARDRSRSFAVACIGRAASGAVEIGTAVCRGQGLDCCDPTEHESRTAAA